MLSIMFWNLDEKDLSDNIARIAQHHLVDIIILAESSLSAGDMLLKFNQPTTAYRYIPNRICDKFQVFSRSTISKMSPRLEGSRYSFHEIQILGKEDILLAILHLTSKLNTSAESQAQLCSVYARKIEEVERQSRHRRTILIGDLNMNPFEPGIIGAFGLHATMCRKIASKETRTINGELSHFFFYNPMWGLLGDKSPGPPGSHYYEHSEAVETFWKMYDQVLIRPALVPFFDNVAILTSDGTIDLINSNGIPRGRTYSDHLPILVKLNY